MADFRFVPFTFREEGDIFFCSLAYQLWGLLKILIGWFIKLSVTVQTFQPLISINRRGNFVYHLWGCKSI